MFTFFFKQSTRWCKLLLLSDQNPQIFKLQKKEKHQIKYLQKAGSNSCLSIHIFSRSTNVFSPSMPPAYLFHCSIIKEDPLGGLGVEGEGTVVAAGVADHPHELQLSLFGMLICHPVEELCPHTHKHTHNQLLIDINATLSGLASEWCW